MNEEFLSLYFTDSYKTAHNKMTPEGTLCMYSNMTPRSGKYSNVPNNGKIVSFGQQMLWIKIQEMWQKGFFDKPESDIDQFAKDMKTHLMMDEDFDVSHMKALHKLGYLPLKVKSLKEGTLIPYGVPMMTFINTKPLNGTITHWITNYLETLLSTEGWQASTSATSGREFIKLGMEWAKKTDPENMWFVDYQFHDFSMRGMGGINAVINSGLGFATASRGSDVLPVIPASRKYYGEPMDEVCINSVAATEHSVSSANIFYNISKLPESSENKMYLGELELYRRFLALHPSGILSMVSDTFDLWGVITKILPELKDEIMGRDGKLVIRPDSGDPVDIICGTVSSKYINVSSDVENGYIDFTSDDSIEELLLGEVRNSAPHGECGPETYFNFYFDGEKYYKATIHNIAWNRHDKQYYFIDMYESAKITIEEQTLQPLDKGVIELLWDIFGGTVNEQGYKVLDPHIGAIYGDSINFQRATDIFTRLEAKGFASTNIVLGIGSYTMQYVTRDTHGSAIKATAIEVGNNIIEIFKDPITDDGTKKSAKGYLQVLKDEDGEYYLNNNCTVEEEGSGELQVIFENGEFFNKTTLTEIREVIKNGMNKELGF